MNRAAWTLRQWAYRCGLAGTVGVALLVLSIVLLTCHILPGIEAGRIELGELNQRVTALQRKATAASGPDSTPLLPAASQYTGFLREHNRLARERSIEPVEIDYASRPEAANRFIRHTLRYTIDGPYPALRAYLEAIEKMAGVRIESVSFVRSPRPDGAVSARVHISYLVEAAS